MFFNTFIVFAAISSSALLHVQAHGTITGVTGANGVQAAGFGIIASTPRDGSSPKPFEQDTSVIRNKDIASGKTGACGKTAAGGNNDVAAQLAAASQAGLPTAADDGSVTMTLHQVNQDGAGRLPSPSKFPESSGFRSQRPPISRSPLRSPRTPLNSSTDFLGLIILYSGMACTAGPNGDACIMRCRNPALAGPFGSCVAVAQGGAAASAGNATAGTAAAAAPAEAAPAEAAPAGAAAAPAAATKAKGLAALFGKGGKRDESAKRYINTRVAGKRSGHWLENQ
ncbi:hypothetical protein DFH08DRAFT_851283 [Mycena albidolilacea]|uniref:Uncharacterized protein n=1 Tax=Mycena albidolilacea TaxID=1033008 RepID=A0AAD7AFK8_9AGAR|nr:hypothetical protein DFH08DRAFT_851283 [Mycena albidolilacea]